MTEQTESTQLSKWWKTPSAQAAFARAANARRERIEKMKMQFAERKATLDAQIWNEEAA